MASVLGLEPRLRVLEALVLTITLYTYEGSPPPANGYCLYSIC